MYVHVHMHVQKFVGKKKILHFVWEIIWIFPVLKTLGFGWIAVWMKAKDGAPAEDTGVSSSHLSSHSFLSTFEILSFQKCFQFLWKLRSRTSLALTFPEFLMEKKKWWWLFSSPSTLQKNMVRL